MTDWFLGVTVWFLDLDPQHRPKVVHPALKAPNFFFGFGGGKTHSFPSIFGLSDLVYSPPPPGLEGVTGF